MVLGLNFCSENQFGKGKGKMMDKVSIASQFVDLALKHQLNWDKIEKLPNDEVTVLFDIVVAAGFKPKAVIPGKLEGRYRDQDGWTGETYPINSLCLFKVVSREDGDDYLATGWLDCALRRALRAESREEIVEAIRSEIERSVPLHPVQLTPEGDLLQEYPPDLRGFGLEYFVEHTRDDGLLSCCVGLHKYCNGWVDRNRATETRDVLVCRKCGLRVYFPREVKTYGELQQALERQYTKPLA